jgi:hypothetical protein
MREIFFTELPVGLHASSENFEDQQSIPNKFRWRGNSSAISGRRTSLLLALYYTHTVETSSSKLMSSATMGLILKRERCSRVCVVCFSTSSCSGRSVSGSLPKDNYCEY